MKLYYFTSKSGFTLVELLVVVTIVIILVTAGFPQYRRMVAKSKQAQAKEMLGKISQAEEVFFAEYGCYGNHIRAMGVQSEMHTSTTPNASVIYVAGFFKENCADEPWIMPANEPGNQMRDAVFGTNREYFNNITNGPVANNSWRVGRMTRVGCSAAVSPIGPTYGTYTARAEGSIASGQNLDNGSVVDVWTVDETRTISHVINGVK